VRRRRRKRRCSWCRGRTREEEEEEEEVLLVNIWGKHVRTDLQRNLRSLGFLEHSFECQEILFLKLLL